MGLDGVKDFRKHVDPINRYLMLGWSWLQYQAGGAAAESLTQLAELNTKPCRHVATVDCDAGYLDSGG